MNRLLVIAAMWFTACTSTEPTTAVCRQYSFSHSSGADTSWVIPCSDTAHVARVGEK